MYKEKLKKIKENVYELPKIGKMKVPGRIFFSDKLLEAIEEDSLKQIASVATLPGILRHSIGMSDMHVGYGFPIGGVAAFDIEKGIIIPGGIGFDINCGVRLISTNVSVKEFLKKRKEFLHDLKRTIPSGVGRGHKQEKNINYEELKQVLTLGAEWAIQQGKGVKEDLENCEENGKISPANPDNISQRALKRGLPQLGTLGAGNHFLEIQKVDEIIDEQTAKTFGINKDNILIMIHCGSRGLGHQIASDYIKYFEEEFPSETKNLPDKELVYAPLNSKQGQEYLSAMNCAVNFAFCNRQIILNYTREVLEKHFPNSKADLIYDVCHNIAKIEEHLVEGKKQKVCVHRKGATRAFEGQPVLIPGSMGTASYVLIGGKKSKELSWSSTTHGAGRVMSRGKAIHTLNSNDIKKQLQEKNIEIEAGSSRGISEEAPQAYKDIDEVALVSDKLDIAKKVVRLVPLAVMKG